MTQYHGLGRHIGFQYCQYAGLGRDIDSTEIQYAGLGRDIGSISTPCILDFSTVNMPQCQYPPLYIIMSISHPWPWATGKYAALGPHYVALGPHDAALGPRAIALRASGGIMGASGDIMFGPWAAYFPVSLGLGCDIVPL